MTNFKSNIEQTSEILDRNNVKEIKEMFHNEKCDCSNYSDNASIIVDLVIENSNDFTKDIASRIKKGEGNNYISAKQAWCVAYQVINNIEVYKLAISNYSISIEDLGFELEDIDE